MDNILWLLVEWLDEKNMFATYGVVNAHNVLHETELHTGKVVFLRDRRKSRTRKAQILRVSDNKQYVKELKILLERQDNQVQNVVSLCMNAIKEMKTGSMILGAKQPLSLPSSSGINMVNNGDDTNSSDSDSDKEVRQDFNLTKSTIRYNNNRTRCFEPASGGHVSRLLNDKSIIQNRRALVSSTPLPDRYVEKVKTADKGTQTDPDAETLRIYKLEAAVKQLYMQFLSLISEARMYGYRYEDTSDDRAIEGPAYAISNEYPSVDSRNTSSVEPDVENEASGLTIRRASAQTTNASLPMITYNGDMASIGNGNVTVPARVLEEIDWTSHTSATRQLLQAVFPRRILATHSLTGKQSPAFVDKPPKKQLNPLLVDDIVNTVSARCGVPKRVVRSSITTKCTDEAKLYRNRQQYKKIRGQNQENVPPSSSTESMLVCDEQENME